MVCKRALISGKVQGVSFRFHTLEKATELGLRGFVRNLADGRVEFVACGDKTRVDELIRWARLGPSKAKVETVESEELKEDFSFDSFYIDQDGDKK